VVTGAAASCSLADDAVVVVSTAKDASGQQTQQQQQQQQQQWAGLQEPSQENLQCLLPELVIRSAADTRTASHGGCAAAGQDCREGVSRQLVQRAGQLGVIEGAQAADLATRALLASSSARQLKSMCMVKSARVTT
jgi:hypothetical protein